MISILPAIEIAQALSKLSSITSPHHGKNTLHYTAFSCEKQHEQSGDKKEKN